MSGHSHAKTVKRAKDANDKKRSNAFSKLSRLVSIAAKEGEDPEFNAKLRAAVEEAKKFNMPKDKIEAAIKRGSGEEQGAQLEEVMYEALGPEGAMLILEGITDNKNRTLAEIKQTLQKHNGKLADEGSLKWQFDKKGFILITLSEQSNPNKDNVELKAIEAGAEDIIWQKDEEKEVIEIRTKLEDLEKVKENLENQKIKVESSTLGWLAKQEIEISNKAKQALEKLFEELDDNDAIQEIYSNLKP